MIYFAHDKNSNSYLFISVNIQFEKQTKDYSPN